VSLHRRRLLVSEVIQTSQIDCGPASLKALLDGFYIRTSYGRLREACQTDVDGTSIDTVEVVAEQLGLDAQQILLPLDHVLLREASTLPAIAVVRSANGSAHFVVAWRCHGPLVQVMDPARGRLWMTRRAFLDHFSIAYERSAFRGERSPGASKSGWRIPVGEHSRQSTPPPG